MGFKSNHLAVVWAVRAQPPPILKESTVQGILHLPPLGSHFLLLTNILSLVPSCFCSPGALWIPAKLSQGANILQKEEKCKASYITGVNISFRSLSAVIQARSLPLCSISNRNTYVGRKPASDTVSRKTGWKEGVLVICTAFRTLLLPMMGEGAGPRP